MGKNNYNTGNAKRWAIFFGIIVLVAIIVVVIILAIPPNTYDAVQTLNRSASTSYLTVNSEQVEFKKFRDKISASAVVRYSTEFYDIEKTALAIDEILDFYNENMVFAKDNQTFKKNYKKIKEGLEDAKDSQKKMVKIVSKTNKFTDSSSSYIQGAIVDYREAYLSYLKASRRAMKGLENAFTGSLGNVLYNNPASYLILNTVNDYMDILVEQYKQLVKTDVKGGNIMTYADKYSELGLHAKVDCFSKFVTAKVEEDIQTETYLYYFDQAYQEKYEKLNNFFTLYSETNTEALIESIKTVGAQSEVTKTYEGVTDSDGIYDYMCQFICGRV